MEERLDKLDFIKIKTVCSAKDNIKRMRRQATVREKIFAKDTSDRGLLYKTYKEFLNLNNKSTNKSSKTLTDTSSKTIHRRQTSR